MCKQGMQLFTGCSLTWCLNQDGGIWLDHNGQLELHQHCGCDGDVACRAGWEVSTHVSQGKSVVTGATSLDGIVGAVARRLHHGARCGVRTR